ncbi:MAG: cyclic nucleotide-binding domain-containing protein [Bacteroidales bacterium]|nr:cyclic nucleotide-binding domain-containing protein [Bacteroidales bacterium]
MGKIANQNIIDDLVELLGKVKIFSETDESSLAEIAAELKEVKIRKGLAIFHKGDEGDAMYIIKSGSVRIHDGNHVLSRLEEGQVFGEFALFDKESRSASVTAEDLTTLLVLEQDDFYRIMADKPGVIKGVLKKVIQRIREMNELEGKLAKSFLKIQKQKNEIEEQHQNILDQKSELEQTNEQLVKLNEEKNQLISIVSHGLRNPLTSSLCVIDLFEQGISNCSEDQQEYLRLIHNSLRRMNSLINQTLDIDIIELQRSKLKPQKVNLAELLEEIESSFKYTLKLKNIDIDLKLQELFTNVDKNYIYIVFDNLLSNAIKFSPVNKKIMIDLFEKEGKAVVEISDQGPGISQEALNTLFDKPQAHHRQTDRTGLSIAKKYIEAMEGDIQCKSMRGQGTTFMVRFPLA